MPADRPSSAPARKISRRRFARDAALAAASATLLPSALGQQASAPAAPAAAPASLASAGQAEVEAKYQAVISRFGARFTEAQKAEVRRQLVSAQQALDAVRAFPLQNADAPATIFRVRRREPAPAKPRKGKS